MADKKMVESQLLSRGLSDFVQIRRVGTFLGVASWSKLERKVAIIWNFLSRTCRKEGRWIRSWVRNGKNPPTTKFKIADGGCTESD